MILAHGHDREAEYERGCVLAGVAGHHPEEVDSQGQQPCRSSMVADFDDQSKGLTDEAIKSR